MSHGAFPRSHPDIHIILLVTENDVTPPTVVNKVGIPEPTERATIVRTEKIYWSSTHIEWGTQRSLTTLLQKYLFSREVQELNNDEIPSDLDEDCIELDSTLLLIGFSVLVDSRYYYPRVSA